MKKVKKCPKCGLKLAESEFYRDATQEDNLGINCKKCVDKYFQQFTKKK
jgi:hypothetical protein